MYMPPRDVGEGVLRVRLIAWSVIYQPREGAAT